MFYVSPNIGYHRYKKIKKLKYQKHHLKPYKTTSFFLFIFLSFVFGLVLFVYMWFQQGALRVISHHGGKVSRALLDLFPDIGLDETKCTSYSFYLLSLFLFSRLFVTLRNLRHISVTLRQFFVILRHSSSFFVVLRHYSSLFVVIRRSSSFLVILRRSSSFFVVLRRSSSFFVISAPLPSLHSFCPTHLQFRGTK
jgi:hypothetical protein